MQRALIDRRVGLRHAERRELAQLLGGHVRADERVHFLHKGLHCNRACDLSALGATHAVAHDGDEQFFALLDGKGILIFMPPQTDVGFKFIGNRYYDRREN